MAVPSSFHERLQQLEGTIRERISLLHSEKQLQIDQSHLLRRNVSDLRSMDQRRLLLEKRHAELGFEVLATKSRIESTEALYRSSSERFRVLKGEIEEIEKRDKEWDGFYEAKRLEMEEFREELRSRVADARVEVESMKTSVSQLNSRLKDLQGNDGYTNNSAIAAAEKRKAELLLVQEELDKTLALNYELKSLLQKQLQKVLASQTQEEPLVNQPNDG